MTKKILERQNYLTSINSLIGIPVFEYDITSAGLSVIKEKKLLDQSIISELEELPKYERNVRIGMLGRTDKDLMEGIDSGLKVAIKRFCKYNDIKEEDIIAIKRDAIFTMRAASRLIVSDHISFRLDHEFSSYINLNRIEFYYSNSDDSLTVRGISKSVIEKHQDYFLDFIKNIIRSCETFDKDKFLVFLDSQRKKYIDYRLDINCYREFNYNNKFKLEDRLSGNLLMTENYNEDLDISYNYINFLLPLISSII